MTRELKCSGSACRAIVCGLVLATPAYAYIDPNAQSLFTQILTPLLIVAATGITFLRKQAGAALDWLAGRLRRKA